MFTPFVGRVPTKSTLRRALGHFKAIVETKIEEQDENNNRGSDVVVVIATDMPVRRWLNSRACYDARGMRLEVCITTTGFTGLIDKRTRGTLKIVSFTGGIQHGETTMESCRQILDHVTPYERHLRVLLKADTIVGRHIRQPSVSILPTQVSLHAGAPAGMRVIIEIEVFYRSLPVLDAWCRAYFDCPSVQAVIGVKFYPARPRDHPTRYSAVAMLFRRADDQVVLTDAVSFGTLAADQDVTRHLQRDARTNVRMLPPPTPEQVINRINPWTPPVHDGFLTVPAQDFSHDIDAIHVPANAPAFQLDLFRLLARSLPEDQTP
ncbi:hypothetical protein PINS_up012113 [Pythium insidiosum]|nr:hypothetical protein PINS_up012113 [Pythium insidiosum]